MGNTITQGDYYQVYTDEPHASRRKEILAKYPQIKELFGFDPRTKWLVLFWVIVQFITAYTMRNASWPMIFFCAYVLGTPANHALFLAIHEISHNLAFPTVLQNKLLGCFANITTVVPHFSMFQRYHMDHHQYQGYHGVDSDIPVVYEGLFITNSFSKLLWIVFQPLCYVIRPLFTKPKQPGFWEGVNWTVVFLVDGIIITLFGWKSLGYLLASTLLGACHAVGGHFIAEHYVFIKNQETYSYYGPLNLITFNVGYHNEHHDFPRIPGCRLPQLRAIAPEYYDSLPCHSSWLKVIYDFVLDDTVGPFSRIIRKKKVVDEDQ